MKFISTKPGGLLPLLFLVIALLVVTGCAVKLPPGMSPEGRLAIYGRQVIVVANSVLTSTDVLTEQRLQAVQLEQLAGRLTERQAYDKAESIKADARMVIDIVQKIGQGGTALAETLQAIDMETKRLDRNPKIEAARQMVLGLQRLVTDGTVKVKDDTLRRTITGMLQQVTDLLLNVAMALPQPVYGR
jgi:hypothetical protein